MDALQWIDELLNKIPAKPTTSPECNKRVTCQKPFNLEGVDFKEDSLDLINLRSVKGELLLENIK